MKRSTAVAFVKEEVGSPGMTPSERAERIVAVLENNQPWDPEEPELPRKLVLCDRTNVITVHVETVQSETFFGITVGDPPRSTAIKSVIRSALDAYNKLQAGELVEKGHTFGDGQAGPRAASSAICPGSRSFDELMVIADTLIRRIDEAIEYLDPSDTVYRILNGEEP